MLATLATRVVAGDAALPMIAAIVVAAAVVGLLAAPRLVGVEPSPATTLPLLGALILVLAANLAVTAELAPLLGVTRVAGVAAAAGLALIVAVTAMGDRWWRLAAPLGVAVVLAPLALVITSVGAPWSAWSEIASRPAFTFGSASAWVTHGRALADGARLTFDEPHRVIAATPATWRVIEREPARAVVREWRLGAGDALTVRPGDQLTVDTGGRVRFEAGRRVPGAPRSGVAWADGRRRSAGETLATLAGVTVTLVVGGVALVPAVPAAGAAAAVAPALVLAFVVGATLWGLYGIALAPELSLVPRVLGPVLEVVHRVQAPSLRAALVGVVLTGLVVLFLGTVLAWRMRLQAAVRDLAAAARRTPSRLALVAGTTAVVALAAALAARGPDPWSLFTWGLGITAAAVVAPRLASAGPRGELAGAVIGVAVLVTAVAANARFAPFPTLLEEHPALIAAPAAWLAARLARSR